MVEAERELHSVYAKARDILVSEGQYYDWALALLLGTCFAFLSLISSCLFACFKALHFVASCQNTFALPRLQTQSLLLLSLLCCLSNMLLLPECVLNG